jgi:hypothetical protein
MNPRIASLNRPDSNFSRFDLGNLTLAPRLSGLALTPVFLDAPLGLGLVPLGEMDTADGRFQACGPSTSQRLKQIEKMLHGQLRLP